MNRDGMFELVFVCRKFLNDNNIECEESCYQSDSVYENAPTLVEDIFTIFEKHEPRTEDKDD